jgi:D-alanyl-D-alanine carboxypeptidase
MTAKARTLGMKHTTYRNASGLPDDAQITTARDQALLGRAIQERFPKYYAYFSTPSFRFRGKVIRGHNRLIGRVEGVDGIKTGYTRASGFNLVSSMKRGNRHIVAVVLGGRSAGTRDAAMRGLLAEYVTEGATVRTASVLNRNAETQVAAAGEPQSIALPLPAPRVEPKIAKVEAKAEPKPLQLASAGPDAAAAAAPAKEPVMLSSGVVAERVSPPVPGSLDPITPTRVKTVAVRAGAVKTASAAPSVAASPLPAPIAGAPAQTASVSTRELPQLAPNHGTGQGILGVLPASALAYADTRASAPAAATQRVASAAPVAVAAAPAKPVMRSGWIVQVGAYDVESEARERLDMVRGRVKLLGKADPFTEAVAKGDKTRYRARFAGLDKDDAEAACKALKRRDIACFTLKN